MIYDQATKYTITFKYSYIVCLVSLGRLAIDHTGQCVSGGLIMFLERRFENA
jgi:hypothetical protein